MFPRPLSRLHRATALTLAVALLAGCATAPPVPPEPPADVTEALRARHAADLSACQAYAQQIGVVQETLDGIVQGALIAAALVWSAGQSGDVARDWAIAGGVMGSTQGLNALERRRRVVTHCMAERGHTGAIPSALAPAPAQPVPPPPLALRIAPPSGTDGFNAERVARDAACSAQPVATLVAKGPGYENYSVPCSNGDALAVRCEFGNCRALR